MAKLTEHEIREILTRYQNGEGTTILGLTFGVDHSSIYYYIKKYAVVRKFTPSPQRIDPYEKARLLSERPPERHPSKGNRHVSRETTQLPHHLAILEEPVNRGKTYAEYLRDEEERKRRARFPQLYKDRMPAAV